MAFTLAATQAPHAGWLNGALAANARQYWLQPTQHTPNGPRIASAISGMTEGELRAVWTDVSGDLFRVRRADDGTLAAILDWTPRMVWDAATEQFLLGGRRGTIKLTAYSDLTGEWRELHMPAALGRSVTGTVHWYGCIAQDNAGRVYYGTTDAVSQTWRLDPVTETWTRLADTPTLSQLGSMFEWFGAAHSGAGGLVKYTAAQRLILLSEDGASWSTLVNSMSNGQHAQVSYHPSHARLLIVGGSGTLRGANLVTAAGAVQAVTDAPGDVTMSGASWVVAHPSGCWLVCCGSPKKLYAAWPNAGYTDVTWVDLGTAPDSALTNSTVHWDGTRERIFIAAESGLYAYRPVELTEPGLSAVSQDFSASYTVYAAVQQSFAGSYSVQQAVARDFSAAYEIEVAGVVSADFSGSYAVLAAVQGDFAGAYAVLQAVYRDFAASFDVEPSSAVTADFQASYSVQAYVQRDFTGAYQIGDVTLTTPASRRLRITADHRRLRIGADDRRLDIGIT